MVSGPQRVLDLGSGAGEIAIPLSAGVERVDADEGREESTWMDAEGKERSLLVRVRELERKNHERCQEFRD